MTFTQAIESIESILDHHFTDYDFGGMNDFDGRFSFGNQTSS